MAYDNRNRGTIAKNDRKSKDTDADITGSINVNGQEFWLNGWQKTNSRDGSKFYSLNVKPKQERAAEIRREQGMYDRDDPRTRQRDEDPDTIPF